MGYWIKQPSGKIKMISAAEIRQNLAAGTFSRETLCVKLGFFQELNPFWKKPFQPLATFPEFAAAAQRMHPEQGSRASGVVTAGWLLFAAGLLCTSYFVLFYSTAVDVGSDSVNNLGLMHNRTIGCIVGLGLAVVGVLMALL